MKISVKLQNFIGITLYIVLCIILILYILLRTESIAVVLPELDGIEVEEIASYEVFECGITNKRYSFVSDAKKLKLLADKLSDMRIRRSVTPAPKMNSSLNIKINLKYGNSKYLKFYGDHNYIPNTEYYITTYVFNYYHSVSDTDVRIDYDGTRFKEYFKSENDGIAVIKTETEFNSYIDSLQYCGIDGNADKKTYYKSQYNEQFFDDKTLLAVAITKLETETSLFFDSIKVCDRKLQIHYNYMPCEESNVNGTNREIHLFEINKKDVQYIKDFEIIKRNLAEIDFVKEVLSMK